METLTYETKYYFCRTSQPNEKYWSHTEFLNPYFVGWISPDELTIRVDDGSSYFVLNS